jgi:hypothetical protein
MFKPLLLVLTFLLPAIASSQTISDDEVDRYLESLPKAAPHLDGIKDELLNGGNKEISNQLMDAGMEGKGTRTAIAMGKDTEAVAALGQIAVQSGFDSLDSWALASDRVSSVLFAGVWVAATHALGKSDSDVTRDTNVFEYIEDESIPQARRDKVKAQLDELCEQRCYDASDMQVVGPRYGEIKALLQSIPK